MQNRHETTTSSSPAGRPFLRLMQNVWGGFKKRTTALGRSVSTITRISLNMRHAADNPVMTAHEPTMAPVSVSTGTAESTETTAEITALPDIFYPSFRAPEEEQKHDEEKAANLNPDNINPHFVRVGAGPTHLLQLITQQKKAPGSIAVAIERNKEYTRTHTLRLNIHTVQDEETKQRILSSPHGKLKGHTVYISAQHLEKILFDYAQALGVMTVYAKAVSREQVEKAFPHCANISFGDGARSLMRKNVFGEDKDFIAEFPMQSVLQLQYLVKGKQKEIEFWDLEASEKLSDFLFEETVTYNETKEESRVTARFFLDEATNNQVPDGNEKNPIPLTGALPPAVQKAISVFLNTRHDAAIEKPLLTKIKLSAYTSKIYAKNEDNRTWVLCGDAAFGVPYFRSLNAGAICAAKVGTIMANHLIKNKYAQVPLSRNKLSKINSLMLRQFMAELVRASVKDFGLDITKSALFSLASVPTSLQPNHWKKSERKRIKAIHPLLIAANDPALTVAEAKNDVSAKSAVSLDGQNSGLSFATSRNGLFGSSPKSEQTTPALLPMTESSFRCT